MACRKMKHVLQFAPCDWEDLSFFKMGRMGGMGGMDEKG